MTIAAHTAVVNSFETINSYAPFDLVTLAMTFLRAQFMLFFHMHVLEINIRCQQRAAPHARQRVFRLHPVELRICDIGYLLYHFPITHKTFL